MRGTLLLCPLAFGLSACAPEGEDGAPNSMPGYELALAKGEKSAAQSAVIDLSAAQLTQALSKGNVRLIDIRRDDEVAAGMIPGAEHIPMESFDPASVTAGDDREIILYCRSGRRSGILGAKLAAHTGTPAKHLEGGIIAWGEAGNDTVMPR